MWEDNGGDYYDICTMEEFDFRLHPDEMQQGTTEVTANLSVSLKNIVILFLALIY